MRALLLKAASPSRQAKSKCKPCIFMNSPQGCSQGASSMFLSWMFLFFCGGGAEFFRDWDPMVTITNHNHHHLSPSFGSSYFFPKHQRYKSKLLVKFFRWEKKTLKKLMQFFGFYFGACHETSQVCFPCS